MKMNVESPFLISLLCEFYELKITFITIEILKYQAGVFDTNVILNLSTMMHTRSLQLLLIQF